MKIVHAVYSLEMGGAEVLVGQLCRIQRANGHDVSVCAYAMLGPIGERLAADGFDIYVPGVAHPALTMLRYLRYFLRLRADVVHCHNPAPTLQAALPARLAGAKCVLSTRHSLVAPPYDRPAERRYNAIARCCDWIVGICEITCENLRGTPWAQKTKIVRVYNGASPVVRVDASGLLSEVCGDFIKQRFTLLFVGRLDPVKDIPTLLRAVALAAPRLPELQLWIVGDGKARPALEALARDLELTSHVRFFGTRFDTAAFFSAADCFVMSSTSEGLPMSLLQSMSVGLPAITTDVGGMAEVLRLSQSGLLVPVGDVPAYADAIVHLAGDATLREQFSERASTAYRQNFTLEQMDAAYMNLYLRGRGWSDARTRT